jgi:prevent-host-death family protein
MKLEITDEIGTYEAKTRLPELLREVQRGRRFTITNRGAAVAQLVPVESTPAANVGAAIDAFLAFKAAHPVKARVSIRELLEDGRS